MFNFYRKQQEVILVCQNTEDQEVFPFEELGILTIDDQRTQFTLEKPRNPKEDYFVLATYNQHL